MEVVGTKVGIYCFTEVTQNTDILNFLKEHQPPVTLVDAKTIVGLKQIQVAVLNALTFQKQGKMEAKNIYLEILRCLSPDARLGGAFKHIALNKMTERAIGITLESEMPEIPGLGGIVAVEEFFSNEMADLALVKEIFSITDESLKRYNYEDVIVTTLAIAASDLVRIKSV
jgi:tRNA threonylcarbamoyladenosine modification (KEOPS) complex Cgi121 subunit